MYLPVGCACKLEEVTPEASNSPYNSPMRKSYFGIASLIVAALSVLFLGGNFGVSQLNITPQTFSTWNNITALAACSLAPLAILLGILGLIGKNDSKLLSGIALVLVSTPFLILAIQLISSLMRSN